MITFGPVPSRRLGASLGINNIPAKHCSYSCVYCQVGLTPATEIERKAFYPPEEIFQKVKERVESLTAAKERIDYLSFVPDGEPTLDLNLGREIRLVRKLNIPVAVITNGSLLWREDVRQELNAADWVSVKVGSASERQWKKIHRPDPGLDWEKVLQGISLFASQYQGQLVIETLLLKDINDSSSSLTKIARFIRKISPAKAYLGVPTRPPAEPWVKPSPPAKINLAYQIFTEEGLPVELMVFQNPSSFGFSGDARADLLAITAVHPMDQQQVAEFLQKAKADSSVVEKLVSSGLVRWVNYRNRRFLVRWSEPEKERKNG